MIAFTIPSVDCSSACRSTFTPSSLAVSEVMGPIMTVLLVLMRSGFPPIRSTRFLTVEELVNVVKSTPSS